jgi:hypothetical protein
MNASEGRSVRALRLGGAASAMFDATGQRPPERWHQFISAFLSSARDDLGPEGSRSEWESGQALDFDDALGYALEEESGPMHDEA